MFRSMQMKGERSTGPAVDIAPLIDIVFILLIFFLVTTTFVRDTGVEVNRPQASFSKSLESTSMRVSVTAEGSIFSEGQRLSISELQNRVSSFVTRERDQAVIVIPDSEVPSGRLIEVMDAARLGGASNVVVATRKK